MVSDIGEFSGDNRNEGKKERKEEVEEKEGKRNVIRRSERTYCQMFSQIQSFDQQEQQVLK
jgi:hypothetical protein